MIRFLLLTSGLFLFTNNVFTQFYNLGQSPARTKWQYYETTPFKIVFPSDYKEEAFSFINYFTRTVPYVYNSLGSDVKKFPIIIHNQSMRSNGFVIWSPQRMELFPLPTQDMLSLNYRQYLVIHELRHVVQMQSLNQGLSKYLAYLLGEQYFGALAGLYMPLWFMEGDAVCTETALTFSGRGRSPDFLQKIRTQTTQLGAYSYDKAVFGSFKDFVPNHYELGYFLTAYTRHYYGSDVWRKTLENVARTPYSLNAFSKGIKKSTGLNKVHLYKSIMDSVSNEWAHYQKDIKPNYFKPINRPNSTYANFKSLLMVNDSLIIAVKSQFDKIDHIVSVDVNGHEQNIKPLGFIEATSLSAHNETLYYVSFKPDKRWAHKSASDVYAYNIKTKKTKCLTQNGRYQTAEISNDGKKIAALYTDVHGKSFLHILNSENGNMINEIKLDSFYLINPSWIDDERILFIAQTDLGKAFALVNVFTAQTQYLNSFSFYNIANPHMFENYIVFDASYTGVNNIFAFDTLSKTIKQLTHDLNGAYEPQFFNLDKKLCYLQYTELGLKIVQTPSDSLLWRPIYRGDVFRDVVLESLVQQEKGAIDFSIKTDTLLAFKPYSKIKHLFNFHSWAPLYVDVDRYAVNPGISIFSQNLLSTLTSTLGYAYNHAEGTGKYKATIDYQGLYPHLSTSISYGKRNILDDDNKVKTWNEMIVSTGIAQPLVFVKDAKVCHLNFFANHDFLLLNSLNRSDSIKSRQINAINYGFLFSNRSIKAKKDLYPKFGQQFIFRYAHTPFYSEDLGQLITGRLNLFFPGFLRNHSFFTQTNWQSRKSSQYAFSYFYPLAKGHQTMDYKFDNVVTTSFNYAFPVFYPDRALGGLLYIKRLQANVFFDYSHTYPQTHYLRSYGCDFSIDGHIFRFVAPVNFGLRYVYNQNLNKSFFEPIFSVNFDNI